MNNRLDVFTVGTLILETLYPADEIPGEKILVKGQGHFREICIEQGSHGITIDL